MDHAAEKVLQQELQISYGRFYFLYVVSEHKTAAQHTIAQTLGYSDPAVSKMVVELSKDGLVQISSDPTHGRRKLVALTSKGEQLVTRSLQYLDDCFSDVAAKAGIDEGHYAALTQQLIKVLDQKNKGDL